MTTENELSDNVVLEQQQPVEVTENDSPENETSAQPQAIEVTETQLPEVVEPQEVAEVVSEIPTPQEMVEVVSETPIPQEVAEVVSQLPESEVAAIESLVLEVPEEIIEHEATDYSLFTKQDFVALLEKQVEVSQSENVLPSDFRKIDAILKEAKPVFDQNKNAERALAKAQFVAENGSEEGFEFKNDDLTQQFEQLYKQLRNEKNNYFQNLDKAKDKNFATKTELINRLRAVVEAEEGGAISDKENFAEFKKIQDEWKAAGNMASPHNAALWQAFHALNDRFYSNRNIYFELLDLDRKKNLSHKIDLCEKAEKIVASLEVEPLTGKMIDEATSLFEEYKQVGPATRETQEALWQRFKVALDTIYGKRREQLEQNKQVSAENYKLKASIAELVLPFMTFQSDSINEWNERTKALLAIQDQWNAVKGTMPREEGRDLSKTFWDNIKTFFRNKSEFFRQLEAKREENLKAKTSLCEQIESLVENGEDSQDATNRVIQAQKEWKNIGHVPEKFKDTIFDRFKKACDAYFDRKRNKNQEVERQYEENLAKKIALCVSIENDAQAGEADVSKLSQYKAQWATVGFVPRKDMQSIQKRYITAINQFVGAMGKLSAKEKEQLVLENEVSVVKDDSSSLKDLQRKEGDIRRRIQTVENDIALWKNNIEFFARSKTTEKLRADFEKKIERAERDLEHMKQQVRIIRKAEG